MACLLSWAISTCFYKIWIWFRNTSVQRFTSKLQHLHPQPPHPTPPHHTPSPAPHGPLLYLHSLLLTSTSHRALELVADVADCRPVVLRKTCCFFLCSSHVRNFSCSAWKSLTTSPCTSVQDKSKGKTSLEHHQPAALRKAECPRASNLLPLKCHLCYRSISWKGLFSSLCCSWRSWPRKQIKVNFSHSS